jgi:hypothetical protein
MESLSKNKTSSSSSLGKSVRMVNTMKHKGIAAQNSAIYNSNNQKMIEPQLSTRNAPIQSHFVAENSGQAILRDLPITNNLQKSGEQLHAKIDRQNSFALYGNHASKRQMASGFGHKLSFPHQHHLNVLKQQRGGIVADGSSTAEAFCARQSNDTDILKARPSTSTRLA